MNELEKKLKNNYRKFCELDHPYPNKELELLIKIHKENLLEKDDYEIISTLLIKYLNIRSDVFHEI